MTDLRRALGNAIHLLRREAGLRRLTIEGGAEEFEEDARGLQLLLDAERMRNRRVEGRDDDVRGVSA